MLQVADVILMSFPFTDLSAQKKRPILVISDIDNERLLPCDYFKVNWCFNVFNPLDLIVLDESHLIFTLIKGQI